MAQRVLWDDKETAVLVYYCAQYKEQNMSRKKAVSETSMLLRNMAKSEGMDIDDTYRNENGISLQMSKMEDLMDEKQARLSKAPQVFDDVLAMYKENRGSFDALLASAMNTGKHNNEKKSNRIAFIDWLKENNSASSTVISYTSALSETSKFANENGICNEVIFEISDIDKLMSVTECLLNNAAFAQKNAKQHNRFRAALNKYKRYLQSLGIERDIPIHQHDTDLYDQRWADIISSDFKEGYLLGDFISQFQATSRWTELYGADCPVNGEELDAIVSCCGTVRDGRVYPYNNDEKQLVAHIVDCVKAILVQYSCAYTRKIYERYSAELSTYGIYTIDVMANLIIDNSAGTIEKAYNYFCLPGNSAQVAKDCRLIFKQHGGPLTTDELSSELWFVPTETIYHTISFEKQIINVGKGTWMLIEHFPLTREDSMRIRSAFYDELKIHEYILSKNIMNILQSKCTSVYQNVSAFSASAVYNAVKYYLDDQFSFSKATIANKGEQIDYNILFSDFASSHERFSLMELASFATELGVPIYWETTYSKAVRISEDTFVSKKLVHFDVEKTDDIINSICQGSYICFKDIKSAMLIHFPSCGYNWNGYMLQSYVYAYSKMFWMCYNSFSKTGYYGAIVRRSDNQIDSYKSLIVRFLSDNNSWKTREDALNALVINGFQVTRRLNEIDEIMESAKQKKIIDIDNG